MNRRAIIERRLAQATNELDSLTGLLLEGDSELRVMSLVQEIEDYLMELEELDND